MKEESVQKQALPEDVYVDVDKVLRQKARKLYPFIPGFLIRYLKRVVHQKEINKAIPRYYHLKGLEFVDAVLNEYFGIDIEVVHPENIPGPGRFIVVSNHPLGGLDGMALMHVIGRNRPDLKYLANDILMELKSLESLFVAVNKHGRNSQESVRIIESLFASDELVMIFPAGLVSRRQKGGVIADLEWKKSFISKAIQHKRDVIPIHVAGRNSEFFYNLARWRKRLGIKTNLEMLYLADEMFGQKDKKIRITFGKPVSYTVFTRARTHYEWAQLMKEHVYTLPGGQTGFNS
jgi:putative hemolysin